MPFISAINPDTASQATSNLIKVETDKIPSIQTDLDSLNPIESNLTPNITPTLSGWTVSPSSVINMVDGNDNTFTGEGTCDEEVVGYIMRDLKTPYMVRDLRFKCDHKQNSTGLDRRHIIGISVSFDNTTFIEIANSGVLVNTVYETIDTSFIVNREIRYIKMFFLSTSPLYVAAVTSTFKGYTLEVDGRV